MLLYTNPFTRSISYKLTLTLALSQVGKRKRDDEQQYAAREEANHVDASSVNFHERMRTVRINYIPCRWILVYIHE